MTPTKNNKTDKQIKNNKTYLYQSLKLVLYEILICKLQLKIILLLILGNNFPQSAFIISL